MSPSGSGRAGQLAMVISDIGDVAALLDSLREAGADEQVTVLADRAAALAPLDDMGALAAEGGGGAGGGAFARPRSATPGGACYRGPGGAAQTRIHQ